MSALYPVVAPITLIVVSINLQVTVDAPATDNPELPNCSNKYVLVRKSVEARILKLKNVPRGPLIEELVPSSCPISPIIF
jgi:hypothetical protein